MIHSHIAIFAIGFLIGWGIEVGIVWLIWRIWPLSDSKGAKPK